MDLTAIIIIVAVVFIVVVLAILRYIGMKKNGGNIKTNNNNNNNNNNNTGKNLKNQLKFVNNYNIAQNKNPIYTTWRQGVGEKAQQIYNQPTNKGVNSRFVDLKATAYILGRMKQRENMKKFKKEDLRRDFLNYLTATREIKSRNDLTHPLQGDRKLNPNVKSNWDSLA